MPQETLDAMIRSAPVEIHPVLGPTYKIEFPNTEEKSIEELSTEHMIRIL